MLSYYDFIQSPTGNGWYIDRVKFNSMLRNKAEECGVKFITTESTAKLEKNQDHTWHYNNGRSSVTSKIIIDASGRHNWLSRRLGIKRLEGDKQVAVLILSDTENSQKSSHSMVEAVSDGWWYVAEGGNKTVLLFFTDPDLHKRSDLYSPAYWNSKREDTIFVKHRVPVGQSQLMLPPKLIAAESSSLPQYTGTNWFITGDAACTLDPLSSHGIAFALRSGIDAGLAASCCIDGVGSASRDYDEKLRLALKIYKEQRLKIYQMENRWSTFPYWQRRHS
jgi:flavin-dependent dehydrogenase